MGLEEHYDRKTPECPYCGQEFEDEHAEGVHRSKEHVSDESDSINEKNSAKNIINEFKRSEK